MAMVGSYVAAAINDLPRVRSQRRTDNGKVASVMSDTSQSTTPVQRHSGSTAWAGMAPFGGIMMVVVGGFQIMQGFVALLRDEYYLVTRNDLVIYALASHGRELEAF